MGGIALEKGEKTRLTVTVSGLYVNKLDHLVEEGLFLSQGEVFRDALRRTFRAYGLEPFREARETEGENEVPEDVVDSTDEKETRR